MPLRYYYDLMSQPSRAMYIFLKVNNVPFEQKPVALRKGEHHEDAFKKINPFSLVPCIDDDGWYLTESLAIAKYVIQKYNLPDKWFPKNDLKKQARVEEYLHWQHLNTRSRCANLFQRKLIIPNATKQKPSPEELKSAQDQVSTVVTKFESYFLKDKPFIAGDEISLADIFAVCEFIQLHGCCEEGLYEQSSKMKAYMGRVRNALNPVFDEAHKMIYRTHDMFPQIMARL